MCVTSAFCLISTDKLGLPLFLFIDDSNMHFKFEVHLFYWGCYCCCSITSKWSQHMMSYINLMILRQSTCKYFFCLLHNGSWPTKDDDKTIGFINGDNICIITICYPLLWVTSLNLFLFRSFPKWPFLIVPSDCILSLAK